MTKDAFYRESLRIGGNAKIVKKAPPPPEPVEEPAVESPSDDSSLKSEIEVMQSGDNEHREALALAREGYVDKPFSVEELKKEEPKEEVIPLEELPDVPENTRYYFELMCDKCSLPGRILTDFSDNFTLSWICSSCGEANAQSIKGVPE